jgi:ribosome biogenesis protein ERB1
MLDAFKERYEDDEEYDTTSGLARLFIRIEGGCNHVTWHSKGDYLSSLSPTSTHKSVLIHRISAAASQLPFNKSKGLVQCAMFHPTQPLYFIATQRHVLVYNLGVGKLIKTLQPVTKWISSIALHPNGNHIIVGGYDRRLSWFDIELSQQPYRTLKYHRKGIRSVAFHSRYPLWASAADDGQIHVMHATVYDDYVTNPMIVPLKIINAHHVSKEGVGCTAIAFHPFQAWIFSASADKTIRLFS